MAWVTAVAIQAAPYPTLHGRGSRRSLNLSSGLACECRSKSGGKFETNEEGVTEYRVLSVNRGLVELRNERSGATCFRDEGKLKMMPAVMAADDTIAYEATTSLSNAVCDKSEKVRPAPVQPSPVTINAPMDGACLYHSLWMGMQHKAGRDVLGMDRVGDVVKAQNLRAKIVAHIQPWIQSMAPSERTAAVARPILQHLLLDIYFTWG